TSAFGFPFSAIILFTKGFVPAYSTLRVASSYSSSYAFFNSLVISGVSGEYRLTSPDPSPSSEFEEQETKNKVKKTDIITKIYFIFIYSFYVYISRIKVQYYVFIYYSFV